MVERGLFAVDRSDEFEYLTYGSSVDELRAYWEQYEEYDETFTEKQVEVEEVYARAEEIRQAAGAGAEVAHHERTRITRLKPV